MSPAAILTHGGVGAPPEWSDGCERAARRGADELGSPGPDAALRAAIEAAVVLEDDPRFNAGTGANLRIDGSIQLDASVATGDGRLGAVACLDPTRNPVRVARLVMDSPHVMLCGDGATSFARERGFPAHDVSTPRAVERHREAVERLRAGSLRPPEERWRGRGMSGTIGAVARAPDGTFAVACSTGGTSLMLRGRIGDSPIYGAGIYSGPRGAVCCTGQGEEIIRHRCATRCYALLEKGEHPQAVADAVVREFPAGYDLGLIVVGTDGHGIASTHRVMASFALTV